MILSKSDLLIYTLSLSRDMIHRRKKTQLQFQVNMHAVLFKNTQCKTTIPWSQWEKQKQHKVKDDLLESTSNLDNVKVAEKLPV